MPLRIRRGTNADRTTITPVQGEPIYTTDTKQLYIGDGTTAGGVQVGGGGTLTVNTQDFTASGTWTKPANALWVEVTMCGGGENGAAGGTTQSGAGGKAGCTAQKTFLASSLPSTVSVTCGTACNKDEYTVAARSAFGSYLQAHPSGDSTWSGPGGSTREIHTALGSSGYSDGGFGASLYGSAGHHGAAFQGGGGGSGGDNANTGQSNGFAGGKAATNEWDYEAFPARGGGGAGGASGTTGVAGTAGGYDTITGFGHGGGGGGEGTAGAGGAGGAAVRGGGGGGGGKGTTAGGAGGAGGAGFVRVRTLCFG